MLELPVLKIQEKEKSDGNASVFVIGPLSKGQGRPAGVVLRHAMLSSLGGYAVQAVKIDGMAGELFRADGTEENGPQIIAALKNMAVRSVDSRRPSRVVASLFVEGPCVATAGDLDLSAEDDGLEVVDPELTIAHVAEGASLGLDVIVGWGAGAVTAADNETACVWTEGIQHIDPFPASSSINSLHAPIKAVAFTVENVGGGSHETPEGEELVMAVSTNGAVSPSCALEEAVRVVSDLMESFLEALGDKGASAPAVQEDPYLSLGVGCLGLTEKVEEAFEKNCITTLGDLIAWSPGRLKSLDGVGATKTKKIIEQLACFNLALAE